MLSGIESEAEAEDMSCKPSHTYILVATVAVVSLLTTAGAASGQTVVVTLDGVPATSCNETWTESSVQLSFVATTSEDCDGGGNCSFGVSAADVGLVPSRLNLDLTGLSGSVTSAEVDVEDFCGTGCTRAFLYQGATVLDSASNTVSGAQTLLLDSGGTPADRLAVSSCEGLATEVRLDVASTAAPPSTPALGTPQLFVLAALMLALGAGLVINRQRSPSS
jgi:hypothetical protein